MHGRLDGAVRPALTAARRGGALADRVAGLVRQRALIFERVAPYKRSANLQRWRSRLLQGRHRALQVELRTDLLRWLPELQRAADWVADAIDCMTSFEAGDRLRGDQRLTPQAAAVVERSVGGLLRACAARASRAR